MKLSIKYSDKVGAASNILCMLHCFATPFIFLSQTQTAHIGHDVPFAWQIINYFFITISGIAVYSSVKNSTNNIVKVFMVLFWLILSFLIISEGLELLHLPELLTYLSASFLSLLHIYNLKYCTCNEEECCIHEKK
jgi:hypothetical protein|tara:strand:+ start:2659 stop:3066 length:408 start_codon:yes stop_codon:yes gene_type:complete